MIELVSVMVFNTYNACNEIKKGIKQHATIANENAKNVSFLSIW
jgi:hypothetical protein